MGRGVTAEQLGGGTNTISMLSSTADQTQYTAATLLEGPLETLVGPRQFK